MDLYSWKLTVLTVCLLITGMVIPVSAFTPSVDTQYDIYEELTVEMPDNELYVHDEIIVKFNPGVSEEKIANINARNGAKVKYTSRYAGFKVLKIPENRNAKKMAQLYSKNPNVEYAEPNYIASTCMVPNDPYYDYQWHLNDINGINVEPAWDISTGSGVIVAVLDTGVTQGTDLADTTFVDGYDFIDGDDDPSDDNSHGTHVAGTIAQSTDNGIGVAGVAFDCSIMPVRVIGPNGGTVDQLASGIYYAADHGADVISMSLAFPPGYNPGPTLSNALDYAYDQKGVTIVAAAGNDEEDVVCYPAAYDKCIAVGATRHDGLLASYSNYGNAIDVVAPGGDSLDQNGDGYTDGVLQQTFGSFGWAYYFKQGTSMATPHVSGVAALLISIDPDATNDEIREAIELSARDLGTPGWDSTYGHGLIDAKAALDYLSVEPSNIPPVADAGDSYTGDEGATITFDGSGSSDLDGTIDSYEWDFDISDGIHTDATGDVVQHTYDVAGEYTATLIVTDNNGAQDTDTATVTINAPVTTKEQMHIKSVTVDTSDYPVRKKTFVYAEANVIIVNESQIPVGGATVYGQWSVSANNADEGTTGTSGEVTLSSENVMLKRGDLTFTFTVTDVTHTDYDWDGLSTPVTAIYHKQ